MLKRLIIVIFLAMQFVGVAGIDTKRIPLPGCFPCAVR